MGLDQQLAEMIEDAVERVLARLQPGFAPAPAAEGDDEVLDVNGLAQYLGVGRNQAYGLVNQPTPPFPVRRLGGRILIHKRGVRAWLLGEDLPAATGGPRRVVLNTDPAPSGVRQRAATGSR